MLDAIDLSLRLKKKLYKPVRKAQIERIFDLSEMVYEKKRPVILVFEGWDAAGKGTTIRQLTAPLDARGFKVLSTQAPRTHEKRKPWLWRFWMNIPRYGQIAIFDRSWYGRVLVERVNGLTPLPQWIAAYEEINNFERTLADDGAVFIKFWLHISRDEQLRRFMALASEPETAWRVTAEDWENHRKYEEYLAAVRDMLLKTSSPIAPWTIVAANDSEVRLYTVFDTIIARLESALDLERTEWPNLETLADTEPATPQHQRKPKDKTKKDKTKKDKTKKDKTDSDKTDSDKTDSDKTNSDKREKDKLPAADLTAGEHEIAAKKAKKKAEKNAQRQELQPEVAPASEAPVDSTEVAAVTELLPPTKTTRSRKAAAATTAPAPTTVEVDHA